MSTVATLAQPTLTTIGRLSFDLRGELSRELDGTSFATLTRPQLLKVVPVGRTLVVTVSRLRTKYGSEIWLRGGTINTGSIRFRNGELVVTSKTLASLVLAYGVIVNYGDLRHGIELLQQDVGQVIRVAMKASTELISYDFSGDDPDIIWPQIVSNLPPEVRGNLQRARDR